MRRTFAQTVVRSKWVWFASIPLALGLMFMCAAAYLQWSTLNFRNHARAIEGRVVRTWQSRSYSTSFRNGNPTSYMAAYKFELDPGGTFRGTDDIGYWGWQRLKPGDRLTVYYLPTAPRRNGLSRPWFSFIALVFGALASMLLFVGCVGVYCVVGDLRKAYIARRPAARHSASPARF